MLQYDGRQFAGDLGSWQVIETMHAPLLNRTVFTIPPQASLGDGTSASSGGTWISVRSVACSDAGSLASSAGLITHADRIRLQRIPRFIADFVIAWDRA